MSSALSKKVGVAALIMTASIFLSRLMGLAREMVIAHAGGAGEAVDAYQVAFMIPEVLNHVVASGFLSVTFIPIFARYLTADREAEGWTVFSLIMTVFGLGLAAAIGVACLFAPALVALLAPGLPEGSVFDSAVRMTRIIIPAQFFFFSGGLFMAVQFARERFLIPALAPLLYNLGIILGGVLLGPRLGIEGFAWGVLGGAFLGNFAVQYYGARRIGMRWGVVCNLHHPDLKRYILLTLPLMVGLSMTFSTEIFMRFFGSFLPPGSIAGLNYGLRIMLLLVAFFGQAVGVAAFPFLARLAAQGNIDELNRLLNGTLRYLALVVPFSVLLMVLRSEVVRVLFQRGQFDAAATALTAQVLACLLPGAFAFAAQTVVVRGYYAIQNTLFPALFGTAAVLASIPFYLVGMQRLGVQGVALAISLSVILQVVVLYVLWNRRMGNPGSRQVYQFYLKIMALSLPLGVLLAGGRQALRALLPTPDSYGGSLGVVLGTAGICVVVLTLVGRRLGIREIDDVLDRVRARLRPQGLGKK
jgi:putative peptidoglycan lipid II flippase